MHPGNIVDLKGQMVQTGPAFIRLPTLLSPRAGLIQRNVCLVRTNVQPAGAVRLSRIVANPKLWERGQEKAHDPVEVVDTKVGMFQTY
jgi:hypothetical protein